MPAARAKSIHEVDGKTMMAHGYAAWLAAISPVSQLSAKTVQDWSGVSADLAREAQAVSEDSRQTLQKFAELHLAAAHKALSAQGPAALAELSSEWAAASLALAAEESQRRRQSFTRVMGLLWPAVAQP